MLLNLDTNLDWVDLQKQVCIKQKEEMLLDLDTNMDWVDLQKQVCIK